MALKSQDFSGIYTTGTGIKYTYILRVAENSVNTTKNTSNVTIQAILKDSYGITFSQWGTGVSCSIDGKEIFSEYKQRKYAGPNENVFYTWTGDLAHGDDGKLTISVSGRLWQNSPANWSPAKITITAADMVLADIARESRIGASDAYIGSATTISVMSNNSDYSHTIGYSFGKLKGYIGSNWKITPEPVKLKNTSISFEIPEDFYSEIAESTYGECSLTITTYNGDKKIGQEQTTKFKCMADPADCSPTVEGSVTDANGTSSEITNDTKKLVRFISTAKCVFTTATAKHGAGIRTMSINGIPTESGTVEIPNVESGRFVFSATDSRGFISTVIVDAEMVPYVKLTCEATCKRTDPTSGNAELSVSGDWFNGNFGSIDNFIEGTYEVFPAGATSPNDLISDGKLVLIPDGNMRYKSYKVSITDLDYQNRYFVRVTIDDGISTTVKYVDVNKGIPVFDWGENDFRFNVPVTVPQVNGVHLSTGETTDNKLQIQTNIATWDGGGSYHQTILVFGISGSLSDTATSVLGVVAANDAGEIIWSGTSGVRVTYGAAGVLEFILPQEVGRFTAISSDPITFLQGG